MYYVYVGGMIISTFEFQAILMIKYCYLHPTRHVTAKFKFVAVKNIYIKSTFHRCYHASIVCVCKDRKANLSRFIFDRRITLFCAINSSTACQKSEPFILFN